MASIDLRGSLAATVGLAILASICFGSPNDPRPRRDAQPNSVSAPAGSDSDTLRLSDLTELRERRLTDLRITDAKYDPQNRTGLRREAAEAATPTTGERTRRRGSAASARTGLSTYEEMRKRKKDRGLLIR